MLIRYNTKIKMRNNKEVIHDRNSSSILTRNSKGVKSILKIIDSEFKPRDTHKYLSSKSTITKIKRQWKKISKALKEIQYE